MVDLVERLEAAYGSPDPTPRFEPLDELVCCILSQHTADANSFPAFHRLRAAFPDWAAMETAGEEVITEHIRSAGLARQKARSIVGCLREIRRATGGYTLEPLRSMPLGEARAWLERLPGVGPKTASIVLCFALGMPAIPVDTHVHRLCRRLGIVGERVGADAAHDLLLAVVPPDLAFRFHMALIAHGRAVCRARRPRCSACVVADLCPYPDKEASA